MLASSFLLLRELLALLAFDQSCVSYITQVDALAESICNSKSDLIAGPMTLAPFISDKIVFLYDFPLCPLLISIITVFCSIIDSSQFTISIL